MDHTVISRLFLVVFELLSAVIVYPIAFQLNDSVGVYVGTWVVALIGLILSFLAHKAKFTLLIGFLVDLVLVVLSALPKLHVRYSNTDYPMTEKMATSLLMAAVGLAVVCLVLRIYLSVIVFFVDTALLEKYSLYAIPVSAGSRATAIQFDTEANPLLVQDEPAKKRHPLLEKVDFADKHMVALVAKKIIIILAFGIAFAFVFQFFYSFLASTIGLMPLAEQKNQTILLVARQASGYLLFYGFAVLAIGVASLFALFSKPTVTRLLLLSASLIIFGIISCFGAAFVAGYVYWPAYVETCINLYPYNSIRRFGFEFDVTMTVFSFILSGLVSAYAFIEFYWIRR